MSIIIHTNSTAQSSSTSAAVKMLKPNTSNVKDQALHSARIERRREMAKGESKSYYFFCGAATLTWLDMACYTFQMQSHWYLLQSKYIINVLTSLYHFSTICCTLFQRVATEFQVVHSIFLMCVWVIPYKIHRKCPSSFFIRRSSI